MKRVAILTPAPTGQRSWTRWRDVYARTAAPLEAEGLQVTGELWTEAQDLSAYDAVLPLLTWGYHHDPEAWIEAVARWGAAEVRLHNPASVLRWNFDKRYLERLAARGAPTVPTRLTERLTPADVVAAAEAFGVERLVVKPTISGGAYRTLRLRPGEPLDEGPTGWAMIQPYLPSVEREGEVSLFYFGGVFSHAVRKVAAEGDFRVQPDFGGAVTAIRPAADEIAAAEGVLASIQERLLYARIDLVRDLDGRPVLIEVELIEPDLYLNYAPDSGAAFGRAVRRLVEGD
jgi:glutathione synthase/RimK-type ligase-like ATP-grasp enzyme